MKIFFLICKSWLKSLLNLKIIFFIFILINIIFAAVLSTFLEIKGQIDEQAMNNKDEIIKIEKHLLIDKPKSAVSIKNLFCNDREESKDENNKIILKTKITMNNKDSCIKTKSPILDQNEKLLAYDDLSKRPRILSLDNKPSSKSVETEVQKESRHFTNSQYYKLIQMYKKTKKAKYLKWANLIKRRIRKEMGVKIKKAVKDRVQKISGQKQIRQNEIQKQTPIEKIISEKQERETLELENFKPENSKEKEKNLNRFMDMHFGWEKRKKLIEKIAKTINDENERKIILQENNEKMKEIIEKEIDQIESWQKLKLLEKPNYQNKKKEELKSRKRLEKLEKTLTNNDLINFIKEKIKLNEWNLIINWIKRKALNEEGQATPQKHWIFSNFHKIISIFNDNLKNNQTINLIKKIQFYLNSISESPNSNIFTNPEFNFLQLEKKGKKFTFQEIKKQIEAKKINSKFFTIIEKKINYLMNLVKIYNSVYEYLENESEWNQIIETTEKFIQKKYDKDLISKTFQNSSSFLKKIKRNRNFWKDKKIKEIETIYKKIQIIKENIFFFNYEMLETILEIEEIKKDLLWRERPKFKITKKDNDLEKIEIGALEETTSKNDEARKDFLSLWTSLEIKEEIKKDTLVKLKKILYAAQEIMEKNAKYFEKQIKLFTQKDKNDFQWLKNVKPFEIFEKLNIYKIYKTELQKEVNENEKTFIKNLLNWLELARVIKITSQLDENTNQKDQTEWEKIYWNSNEKVQILFLFPVKKDQKGKFNLVSFDKFEIMAKYMAKKKEIFEAIYKPKSPINILKLHLEYQEKKWTKKEGNNWIKNLEDEEQVKKNNLKYWKKDFDLNVLTISLLYEQFHFYIKKDWISKKKNWIFKDEIREIRLTKKDFNYLLDNSSWDFTKKQAKLFFVKKQGKKCEKDWCDVPEKRIISLSKEKFNSIDLLNEQNDALNEKLFGSFYYLFGKRWKKGKFDAFRSIWLEIFKKSEYLDKNPELFSAFILKETFIFQLRKYLKEKNKPTSNDFNSFEENIKKMKKKGFNTNYYLVNYILLEESQGLKRKLYITKDIAINNKESLYKPLNEINLAATKIANKDIAENSEEIEKRKTENSIIKRAILELNNFKTEEFEALFIRNDRKEKKYLIINNDPEKNLKIKLFAGNNIVYDNEIIISPTFARNNKIKIGDILNIEGIKNLKVVGIGVQAKFYYPLIDPFSAIPGLNEGIIYTSKNLFLLFGEKKEKTSEATYTEKRHHLFINYKDNNKNDYEQDLWLTKNYLNFKGYNETKLLWWISKKEKIKEDLISEQDYETNSRSEQIWKLNDFHLPYGKVMYFVKANYQIMRYSSIISIVLISLIIALVMFYIIDKKIKNNFKQIGILKSLGISDFKILSGILPICIFVFGALVLGWIISVFFQLIIFEKMETILNFSFKKYYFNFTNLLIIAGIVFGTIFFICFSYKKFYFEKLTVLKIMSEKRTSKKNWIILWLKKILNKTRLNKYLIIKINQLFFPIIWRKVFLIFISTAVVSTCILSFIFILSTEKKTIEKNFKNINYNWEINYLNGVSGNPWTRRILYLNSGYDSVKKAPDNSLEPIKKWGIKILLKTEKGEIIKYDLKNLGDLLELYSPLHGKIFNYNWIMHLLRKIENSGKTDAEREANFCAKFTSLLRTLKITLDEKQNDKNCLSKNLDLAFPIKLENRKKAIKHFPFGSNVVSYNPEKDEFFTKLKANINNKGKIFDIYGIEEKSKNFNFPKEIKQKLQVPRKKEKTISGVANINFLKRYKLKVGDTITVQYVQKKLKNGLDFVKDENWYYEDGKTITPLSEISPDAKWYAGSTMKKIKSFGYDSSGHLLYKPEDKDKKEQKVKLIYYPESINKKEIQSKEWLDIEKVVLETDKKRYPFKIDQKASEIEKKALKKTNWNSRVEQKEIQNVDVLMKQKIKIVGKIEEYGPPKLFISQGNANEMLGFNRKKNRYGKYEWFNGKWTTSKKISNTFFNFSYASEYGFVNTKSLEMENAKTYMIKGIQPIFIKKQIISQIINYFLEINLVFLISIFTIMIILFFLLTTGTLKQMQKINLELKTLGFSKKTLLWSTIQILLLPTVLGFLISWFISNYLFTFLLNNLSLGLEMTFFYDNSILSFAIAAGIMILFVALILFYKYRSIKKANLIRVWYS